MTSHFNETHPCPGCHHTGHAISKDLHTYKLFYGRVRRPALYCKQCDCTQPLALPVWLWMKWGRRDWQDYAS